VRLQRKDCFFGFHFDLHPTEKDAALGRDLTDAMVAHLLETCGPDFIQYDSKGHPGYLGFPSKTGMSAPGIVNDSLEIWRRVTAAHGVALYNHFSGLIDRLAVTKHPDWSPVDANGERTSKDTGMFGGTTSLFSEYEQELMIPELKEVALKYHLDGSWVDGDCWAVQTDYCDEAKRRFQAKTGLSTLPRKPEDPGWAQFLEVQREAFREYVKRYVDALHQARPGYEITSNWLYSAEFAPERPEIPIDYVSGDLSWGARQARLEARYLPHNEKPWDLMSWGHRGWPVESARSVAELEQEASIVLAQGGAYQIDFTPSRAGWIDDRVVNTGSEVARFCRQRQPWSHRSQSIPEVGVLYSGRSIYRTTGPHVFGGDTAPATGALDLLLSYGYSVDLIPDWQLSESAASYPMSYPMIVVPDWQDIGDEAADTLTKYAGDGGKLAIFGAENATLFADRLGMHFAGPPADQMYSLADDTGFTMVRGRWLEFDPMQPHILAYCYPAVDTRKDSKTIASLIEHGEGSVVVCTGPLLSGYEAVFSPILRSLVREILKPLPQPAVRLDKDYPALEIVLRKKDGQMLVHLINVEGAFVSDEQTFDGMVPNTGPIRLHIKLPKPPLQAVLEPEGAPIDGEYRNGEWSCVLPGLHIHSIIRIAS
jgi:hypothetical protein